MLVRMGTRVPVPVPMPAPAPIPIPMPVPIPRVPPRACARWKKG